MKRCTATQTETPLPDAARRVFALAGLAVLAGSACAQTVPAARLPDAPEHTMPVSAKGATGRPLAELGIEFVGLHLTAENFMVDLRYRITDAAQSKQLVDRNVQAVLVNEATGDRYYVPRAPKVGPLRQTATAARPVQLGKVYFMLFANPDRRLRVGEKVTLYAGDSVLKELVVQ